MKLTRRTKAALVEEMHVPFADEAAEAPKASRPSKIGADPSSEPIEIDENFIKPDVPTEEYVLKPLSEIEYDEAWNLRSGKWDAPGSAPEAEMEDGDRGKDHFSTFCADIVANGQETPIDLAPNWTAKSSEIPFHISEGHRRYKAFLRIYKQGLTVPGIPPGMIKCRVLNHTPSEARLHNLRSAIHRDPPSKADLAWAVGEVMKDHPTWTAGRIKSEVGLSSGYTSILMRIQRSAVPRITQAWRKCEDLTGKGPVQITVEEMDSVAKQKTPEEQVERYTQIVNERLGRKEPTEEDTEQWLRAAKKKAVAVAETLGRLVNAELFKPAIAKYDEEEDRWETILMTCGIKMGKVKKPNKRHIKLIVSAMIKTYVLARDASEESEEDDE